MSYVDRIKNWWEDLTSETEVEINTNQYPIDIVTPQTELNAHLYVPTKSDGATISQSGWEIGGGTITGTTSSGSIDENIYKDNISLLSIKKDEIEVGVLLSDDVSSYSKNGEEIDETEPERVIRIPTHEITDVRNKSIEHGYNTFPGFTFETADEVYKIGFFTTIWLTDGVSTNIEDNWIQGVVENIRTLSEKQESAGEEDAMGKLERLNELHKKGALSDAEFEEKKEDLLDDI